MFNKEDLPLVTPDELLFLPRVLRTTPDLFVVDRPVVLTVPVPLVVVLVLPTVEPLFPDVRVLPVVLTVDDPLFVPERVLRTVLPVDRPVLVPLVLPVYREPVEELPELDLLVIALPPFRPVRVIAAFPELPLPDRVLVPVIALFPFPLL